jgi:hypothetical protein
MKRGIDQHTLEVHPFGFQYVMKQRLVALQILSRLRWNFLPFDTREYVVFGLSCLNVFFKFLDIGLNVRSFSEAKEDSAYDEVAMRVVTGFIAIDHHGLWKLPPHANLRSH